MIKLVGVPDKEKFEQVSIFSFFLGEIFISTCRLSPEKFNHLFLSWSTDGLNFSGDKRQVEIKISPRKKEKIETCSNFSLSGTPTSFIMTYVRAGKTRDKDIFVIAKSKDLYAWTVKSEVIRGDSNQATVVYDKLLDLFILYKDGLFSKCQQTRTLTVWKESHSLLFTSRQGMFDSEHISIIGSLDTKDG